MSKFQKLIFLLYIYLELVKSQTKTKYAECVEDSKIKQACAILKFVDGKPVYEVIKKHKCKGKKKCLDLNSVMESNPSSPNEKYPTFKTCQEKKEAKNANEKCNYGGECKSLICESNKCVTHAENGTCKNNYSCESAKYFCKKNNSTDELGNCTKLININESCSLDDFCEIGYGCNATTSADNDGKCIKFGSITDNIESKEPEFCYSGLNNATNESVIGYCFNATDNTTCVDNSCYPKERTNLFLDYLSKFENETNTDEKKKKFLKIQILDSLKKICFI